MMVADRGAPQLTVRKHHTLLTISDEQEQQNQMVCQLHGCYARPPPPDVESCLVQVQASVDCQHSTFERYTAPNLRTNLMSWHVIERKIEDVYQWHQGRCFQKGRKNYQQFQEEDQLSSDVAAVAFADVVAVVPEVVVAVAVARDNVVRDLQYLLEMDEVHEIREGQMKIARPGKKQ